MKAILLFVLFSTAITAKGQESVKRILAQDSTLNNLVDPPGYQTSVPGTLGGVLRVGTGKQAMILIPGLGFGGSVFAEFMERFAGDYSMYAVTLPGFSGTPAPPSPGQQVSFGEQSWTNSALSAITTLINEEKLDRPVIVGHWLTGTQLALRLALDSPEKIRAVVILAGSARMTTSDTARARFLSTPERRIATMDNYMGPHWFKTVTRETWDDNNFLPGDYVVNPVRGLRLWREAARPNLHVWVRYLCEFNAQDIGPGLKALEVPTLLVKPGLEGLQHDPGANYMDLYCNKSWEGYIEGNERITVATIPDSRVCLWFDQPAIVDSTVREFLKRLE